MKMYKPVILIAVSLLIISAIAHAQVRFEEGASSNNTSHPAIHHSPPLMPADIQSLSGRVNANGFDALLAARFQFVVDSMLYTHNLMGASAAIIVPGKGTWLGAGGFSDPVNGDTIRSDMLFEISSNTKAFVATIILQMV